MVVSAGAVRRVARRVSNPENEVRVLAPAPTLPNQILNPKSIWIRQTDTTEIVRLQRVMSKAVWRPAPGRKLGFVVQHDEAILGILFLASPVINLGVRDMALGLTDRKSRGKDLRHYMDLSVCVSSQPIGWHWNLGKLMALLATTLGTAFEERYHENLIGIVTTSLYGHGSQYNRIYKFLGYTKGFGHEQITDEAYHAMLDWMRENDVEIPSSRFGAGPNPRMRRINAYRKASGDSTVSLRHNKLRGVYYHEVATVSRQEVIQDWYDRWGLPRYLRTKSLTPPYTTGLG